jgi:flagellar assembly protein FliH
MSSSKPGGPRQVPPPPNSRAGNAYTRFIPREELQGFANWTPDTFGGMPGPPKAPSAAEAEAAEAGAAELQAALHEARQAGYETGYRDGLVALESFKQSFAQQMSGQFAPLLHSFETQLAALEQRIAAGVASVATQLARQVVRSELAARPELVAAVAQEAVHAVLMSAKHIVVKVHPADHALVADGAAAALAARGARLQPLASLERGGCLVETDAGNIDARVASRWNDAVQALATDVHWDDAGDDASRDDFR